MLIGYWPGETHADRDYRRARLREWGARPYPMPYVRTPELVGFQRWVIGAYDKRIARALPTRGPRGPNRGAASSPHAGGGRVTARYQGARSPARTRTRPTPALP